MGCHSVTHTAMGRMAPAWLTGSMGCACHGPGSPSGGPGALGGEGPTADPARQGTSPCQTVCCAREPVAPQDTIALCREAVDAITAIQVVDAAGAIECELDMPLSELLRVVVPTLAYLDPEDPQGWRPDKHSVKSVGRLAKVGAGLFGKR